MPPQARAACSLACAGVVGGTSGSSFRGFRNSVPANGMWTMAVFVMIEIGFHVASGDTPMTVPRSERPLESYFSLAEAFSRWIARASAAQAQAAAPTRNVVRVHFAGGSNRLGILNDL